MNTMKKDIGGKMNWYEENIEEPVRDVVRLLRDNGFNTTCSCGHKKYIEGTLSIDGELLKLHKLLYDYQCENGMKPEYEITFTLKVCDGYIFQKWFEIKLK